MNTRSTLGQPGVINGQDETTGGVKRFVTNPDLCLARLRECPFRMTTLYIKNMVCDRCRTAVKGELDKNQIPYRSVELGEVEVGENIPDEKIQAFRTGIEQLGFELIDNKKSKIIEAIKAEIINMIR